MIEVCAAWDRDHSPHTTRDGVISFFEWDGQLVTAFVQAVEYTLPPKCKLADLAFYDGRNVGAESNSARLVGLFRLEPLLSFDFRDPSAKFLPEVLYDRGQRLDGKALKLFLASTPSSVSLATRDILERYRNEICQAKNTLRKIPRRGKALRGGWKICYAGGCSEVYGINRSFEFLRILLSHAGTELSCMTLCDWVDKPVISLTPAPGGTTIAPPGTEGLPVVESESRQVVYDERAIGEFYRAKQQLVAQQTRLMLQLSAIEGGGAAEMEIVLSNNIAKLACQIDAIDDVLNNHYHQRTGAQARFPDLNAKRRQRVSKALHRLLDHPQLLKAQPLFVAHLKEYLSIGSTCCYNPPPNTDWYL
jgi:hypothetical protein